jgi:hypothetical protein
MRFGITWGKQVHGKDCVRRLSFFHKKFGASVLFVLLGRIGATANMSRLDTEMANDLIAFARNLRSRGFVTRPSSTAPNRRGHTREAFR